MRRKEKGRRQAELPRGRKSEGMEKQERLSRIRGGVTVSPVRIVVHWLFDPQGGGCEATDGVLCRRGKGMARGMGKQPRVGVDAGWNARE